MWMCRATQLRNSQSCIEQCLMVRSACLQGFHSTILFPAGKQDVLPVMPVSLKLGFLRAHGFLITLLGMGLLHLHHCLVSFHGSCKLPLVSNRTRKWLSAGGNLPRAKGHGKDIMARSWHPNVLRLTPFICSARYCDIDPPYANCPPDQPMPVCCTRDSEHARCMGFRERVPMECDGDYSHPSCCPGMHSN